MNLDSDAATKKMIGNSLTHYRITAKLGEGGMGEVYRASDRRMEPGMPNGVCGPDVTSFEINLRGFEILRLWN